MSCQTISHAGLLRFLRRTVIHAAATLGATCTLFTMSAAQTEPALTKGKRVRVVIPAADGQPERFVSGSLLRLERDTVVVWTGGTLASPQIQTIALTGGPRLETLTKGPAHGKAGARLGAVVGAFAGAVIGAATWQPCREQGLLACFMYPSQGEQAAGGATLGAVGGALLGLVLGSSIRSETWVPVHTAGVHVAVASSAVGVSIAF